MKQQKGLFQLIYLTLAGIFLVGFRVPGESPTKYNDFISVRTTALLMHTSNEPLASTVPMAKAKSFSPIEQGEANCDNNLPPTADVGSSYDAIFIPGESFAIVNFDASRSGDSDGTIEDFLWEFGNNGVLGTGMNASFKFWSPGQYEARLTVTDNCGATSQDTAEVTIARNLSYPPFSAECTDAQIAHYTADFAQSEFARLALPACGPAAVPSLISIVENESSDLQCEAAQALADMGEEAEAALPALTSLFRNEQCLNPYSYLAAVGGKAAVPVFIEALVDKNEDIRYSAAIGLGEIGEDAHDSVPALIEALNREGPDYFKEFVAKALGEIGTDADEVVPALIKLYEETEREAAIGALAKFGPDARDAIPQIEQAFTDSTTRDPDATRALASQVFCL